MNAPVIAPLAPPLHSSKSDRLVLLTLVCTAALLDLHAITSPSLWMDEGFSIFMARTAPASFWAFVRGGEVNMLLYYGLFRAWMQFDSTEFWLRLFSAVWAIATVPVVYALGRRLGGRRLAVISAMLFAVHPAEIAFAQEARSYALAIFLVALSCLFLLRLVDEPRALNAAGYAVASALAVYAHLFAILVLAAQWMWLVLFSRWRLRRPSILASGAAVGLLIAPLAVAVLRHTGEAVNWIPPLRLADIAQLGFLLGLPTWRIVLWVCAWTAAIVGGIWRSRRTGAQPRLAFVTCWLAIPILLALGVSFFKPMLVPRFLLVCLPASVLLAAWGLAQLRRSWAAVAVVLIAFASLNSALAYYRHLGWKENWRGAANYVLEHAQSGDTVVVVPTYARFTFDYYRQQAVARPLTYAELSDAQAPRTWLLVSTVGLNLPGTKEALKDWGASAAIETHHFDAIDVWLLVSQPQKAIVVSKLSAAASTPH